MTPQESIPASASPLIEEWAIRLAREVAPDEVDLAPMIAEAYAAGGEAREALFQTDKGDALGGFGAGQIALIVPVVFHALASAALTILRLFSSRSTEDILRSAKDSIDDQKKVADAARSARAKAAAPAAAQPQGEAYVSLQRVAEVIAGELRARGMPGDQCDAIGFRVLRALMREPTSGARLVQALASTKP